MGFLKNMKIGSKIMCALIGVTIIMACVCISGIYQMDKLDDEYSEIYNNYGLATGDIANMATIFNQSRSVFRDVFLYDDAKSINERIHTLQEVDKNLENAYQIVLSKAQSEEAKKELGEFKNNLEKYNYFRDQALQMALQNKDKEAWSFMVNSGAVEASNKINTGLASLYNLAKENGMKQSIAASERAHQTMYMMWIVMLVVTIVAIVAGVLLARTIAKRLNILVDASEKIANGDLSTQLKIKNLDEIGSLAKAFEKMRNHMNIALANIDVASEQVAAGAKNVSDASISLSQGATEQASSVEELSSSLEEISSQTKLNAEHADEANKLTINAQKNAKIGNEHMKAMLTSMTEINGSSANISKIIKVIDEIAFQTNILALNAAVEAARAGQHGKGFAVVAEEVRNLAARSAKAAEETTEMIEGSIAKVNEGTKIANKTAEALDVIVEAVTGVASLIDNIAHASNEQSIALEQINQGVLQVSQVVQANSATAEESAAASEELSAQASLLKDTIGEFKFTKNSVKQNFYEDKVEFDDRKKSSSEIKLNGKKKSDINQIALTDDEFGKY